jgi:hypothetical protein
MAVGPNRYWCDDCTNCATAYWVLDCCDACFAYQEERCELAGVSWHWLADVPRHLHDGILAGWWSLSEEQRSTLCALAREEWHDTGDALVRTAAAL